MLMILLIRKVRPSVARKTYGHHFDPSDTFAYPRAVHVHYGFRSLRSVQQWQIYGGVRRKARGRGEVQPKLFIFTFHDVLGDENRYNVLLHPSIHTCFLLQHAHFSEVQSAAQNGHAEKPST